MIKKLWYKIKRFFEWLFFADHQIFYGRISVSLKGQKWELHITDKDPNPSVPHLHCVGNKNMKINVYNGEIYEDGINIGKLKNKEFNSLWHDKKFLNMVKRAREFYLKEFPDYKLVAVPFYLDDIDNNVIISFGETKNQLIIEYRKEKKNKNHE